MSDYEPLLRKEFQILQYKSGPKLDIGELQISTQQLFTARWMHLSDTKRCVLKHSTGSGKTISSIFSAAENLKLYKLLGSGKIIIVGFQKNTFINEMLDKPELGFVSKTESDYLKDLAKGTTEQEREKYKSVLAQIKNRIFNDGYVVFFGYQELYNALFEFNEGKFLRANPDTLQLFEYSFVIADEIHNVYNSQETNTYGQALKYILDYYVDKPTEPKFLFMSATPLSYHPSEVIDLLNLVVPNGKFEKKDFFSPIKDGVELLLPGALKKIKEISSGYFSFYINEDFSVMPRKIFEGKEINGLYFEICENEYQDKILENLKVALDDHNAYDAIFPTPDNNYIYKTSDYRKLYQTDPEWCQKRGFRFYDNTMSGPIFNIKNIKNCSEKYYQMLTKLNETSGKVLIYHEFINGSGIKMIEQVLLQNGYISVNSIPNENTRCLCGVIKKNHHSVEPLPESETDTKSTDELTPNILHRFVAARYIVLHGEIDRKIINNNLKIFNAAPNAEGHTAKIALGSEIAREGMNFKCVRNLFIMHLLPHLPAYIQLIGRGVRTMSHADLPPEKRYVKIFTFAVNAEIERYKQKIQNYRIIQEIDRVINEDAVDVSFYSDIIKKSFTEGVLGILPYHFNKKTGVIKLDAYNTLYKNWEIEEIKKIITGLFRTSPAWTLEELWQTVQNPPYMQFIDCSKFSEKNFKQAFGDMVYGIRPAIIYRNNVPHKIRAVKNKIIYYVSYPTTQQKEPVMGYKIENMHGVSYVDNISWLQSYQPETFLRYDVTNDLVNLNMNYEEMKRNIYTKFSNVDIVQMPLTTEFYSRDFHIKFLEESIMYIFNKLTGSKIRSTYHEFYFKMVHFYWHLDLVVYANALPKKYASLYDSVCTGDSDTDVLDINYMHSHTSITSFNMSEIDAVLLKSEGLVPRNILPVGHFLSNVPRLYLPTGWIDAREFEDKDIIQVENNIIIGYYEKSPDTINFSFKLRKPLHKMEQQEDLRNMEKGIVCETKLKGDLQKIARDLGVIAAGTNTFLCQNIKEYLLYNEMDDRKKYREGMVSIRTRWCYLQYECEENTH